MNILYVINPGTRSEKDGIKQQALIWKEGLGKKGHHVTLHTPWDPVENSDYDLIHIFGNGLWLIDVFNSFYKLEKPIVISPIIDSFKPHWQYKIASLLGLSQLRLYGINYALRFIKPYVRKVFVRSQHEYGYINKVYGYKKENIALLPLPSRITEENIIINPEEKEDFCFHLSTYTQSRKNVWRLMEAAVKYKFKLVIAGKPDNKDDEKRFADFANQHPNISIIGTVSEDQLRSLYKKAKVFALPSIDEGVGFVALEAATFGCNIVITNIGGPKEYYKDLALQVNPYSVDEIGESIVKAMNSPTSSSLSEWIRNNYSLTQNIQNLEKEYLSCIGNEE